MNIAIISSHSSQNTLDLQAAIQARDGHSTVYALKDVAIAVDTLESHPFFGHDAYIFRGYNKSYSFAQALAQALVRRQKVVIDAQLTTGFIPSKFHEALMYKDAGVTHIPTFAARNFEALLGAGFDNEYPVVVKDVDSEKGRGVRLAHNEDELRAEIQNYGDQVIIQKFMTLNYDIRVLCIGDSIVGAIKRESTSDDFRTNVSLGGTASVYELNEQEATLALKAHKAMGYDISGVDVAVDSNGTPFIIETNITPEWQGFKSATGIDVAARIIDYATERLRQDG